MDQLLNSDLDGFRKFGRLFPELFIELVQRVGPVSQKEKTRFQEPLPVGLTIAITRYLVTGDSYMSLVASGWLSTTYTCLCQRYVRQSTRFTRMRSSSVQVPIKNGIRGHIILTRGGTFTMLWET